MRRIALIGTDELLAGRVQAAVADLALLSLLPMAPAEFTPELAAMRAALVLVEVDGPEAVAALPQIMKSIARVSPDLKVVVIGDAARASDVLAAVRAGSSDFIDHEEPIASLHGHIERCLSAANEGAEPEVPEAFSVVLNAQPGSGAGLFALSLGVLRAQHNGEALLIDCHLPVSEAGAALDVPLTYALGDAVRDTGRLDRTLLLSSIAHHEPSGLRVLPLSLRSTDDIGLSPETLLAALRTIRPLFSETVLNAGGIREPVLLSALSQWASAVYLVCPQKFTALRDARDLLSALPASFDAADRITLIVDDFSPGIDLSPDQMLAALQLRRMIVLPEARDDLINGLNIGRPYVLAEPRSPYALAVQAAADRQVAAAPARRRSILPGNFIASRLRGRRA
jgi:pilus assembly protein CpaE